MISPKTKSIRCSWYRQMCSHLFWQWYHRWQRWKLCFTQCFRRRIHWVGCPVSPISQKQETVLVTLAYSGNEYLLVSSVTSSLRYNSPLWVHQPTFQFCSVQCYSVTTDTEYHYNVQLTQQLWLSTPTSLDVIVSSEINISSNLELKTNWLSSKTLKDSGGHSERDWDIASTGFVKRVRIWVE